MAAGTSQSVTFAAGSIPQAGFYTVSATALLSNDQNHGNDQLSGILENAGPLTGTYLVGSSQPVPFNTLTAAVARLNTVGVSGPVVLQLANSSYGPSETFPININGYTGASATNRTTIRPAPGVVSTITGSTTRAIFVLNGADYVTIDGSNSGGTTRDLTIVNTDPSQGSAVIWGQTGAGNPATNDAIKNLVLSGSGGTQTLFGVGFGASTIGLISGGVGNNTNSIENCLIKKVQYGIYSAGFSNANKNSGIVWNADNSAQRNGGMRH